MAKKKKQRTEQSFNSFADFAQLQQKVAPKKEEKTLLQENKAQVTEEKAQDLAQEIRWRRELALYVDDETAIENMHKIAIRAQGGRVKLTQIRQLENIVHSARSWSEVINFIYRQLSKHRDWQGWGKDLESAFQEFIKKAQTLAADIWGDQDLSARLKQQESALIVLQGMVGHLSARFAFEDSKGRG